MKKLLFSFLVAGISTVGFHAQTWNFSTWAVNTTGVANGSSIVVDGLTVYGSTTGSTTMGQVDNNNTTWGSSSTGWNSEWTGEAEFVSTKRLKFGGASQFSGQLPTGRYISFPVSEPTRIQVWFRQGGDSGRTLHISDGTNDLFTGGNLGNQNINYAKVDYTGNGGVIYIFCESNAFNLYQIKATALSTLSVGNNIKNTKSTAFSNGNKIYLKDLDSKATDVKVYNANGSLVKSLKTSTDTNFEINAKGVYIVNMKSEKGEKSVKVLIK